MHVDQAREIAKSIEAAVAAALRADVVRAMPARGQSPPRGQLPFTPAAKRLLECTLEGAVQLGQDRIGSEHLLLALIRAEGTPAGDALRAVGATLDRARVALRGGADGYAVNRRVIMVYHLDIYPFIGFRS